MKQFVLLGLLTLAGCVPTVTRNPIALTAANQIALQDGTPSATLIGHAGNPQASICFVFPNGETLTGNADMSRDINNTMGIWGQTAQTLSPTSAVQMVAIDGQLTMTCRGIFNQKATDLICNLSDGAIYRDVYTAPAPQKTH